MRIGLVVGVVVAGLASVVVQGCLACNEPGCAGGFAWEGQRSADEAVAAGSYRFELTVENDRYTVECQISDTYGDSECGDPAHAQGSVDFDLGFGFRQVDPDNWNPSDGVAGFDLRIADTTGSDPTDSYNETRGPNQVSIVATVDDAPLFEVDYDLEYARDDNFYGDSRCGFCDSSEERALKW